MQCTIQILYAFWQYKNLYLFLKILFACDVVLIGGGIVAEFQVEPELTIFSGVSPPAVAMAGGAEAGGGCRDDGGGGGPCAKFRRLVLKLIWS